MTNEQLVDKILAYKTVTPELCMVFDHLSPIEKKEVKVLLRDLMAKRLTAILKKTGRDRIRFAGRSAKR